jgi:hypothetical protein
MSYFGYVALVAVIALVALGVIKKDYVLTTLLPRAKAFLTRAAEVCRLTDCVNYFTSLYKAWKDKK